MAVPLPTLLAVRTPYEWHDAVAIVLQLIEQSHRPGRDERDTLPDLRGITLLEDGTLGLDCRDGRTTSMMPGAAQLLKQLLSLKEQPPALAAFAMRSATALPGDPDAAIDVFVEILLGWERPDRAAKLRALHGAALRILDEQGGPSSPSPSVATTVGDEAAPPRVTPASTASLPSDRAAAATRATLAGRVVLWTAGFTIPVLIVVAVTNRDAAFVKLSHFLAWPGPRGLDSGLAVVAEPPDTRADTAINAVAAPNRPAAPLLGRSTQAAESPLILDARKRLNGARMLFEQGDYAAAERGFFAVIDLLRADGSLMAGELRQSAIALRTAAQAAAEAALADATRQYAAGDPAVEPAQPLSILPELPTGTPDEAADLLELHIDRNGLVEKVTFLRGPSVRNRSLASVAKAWRFRPAMKDGRPVRFVTRIAIDNGGRRH